MLSVAKRKKEKTLSCFKTALHKVEGMFSQVPEMLGPVGVAAGLLYAFSFYPSNTRGVSPAPPPPSPVSGPSLVPVTTPIRLFRHFGHLNSLFVYV